MEKATHDIEFSRENEILFHFSLFFNIFIQVLPDYNPSSPRQSLPVFNLFSEDAHAERNQTFFQHAAREIYGSYFLLFLSTCMP